VVNENPLIAQVAVGSVGKQFVVGEAAPKEVREPRGELVIGQLMLGLGVIRLGVAFHAEQKMGRHEHAGEGDLHRLLKRVPLRDRFFHEAGKPADFFFGRFATVSSAEEVLDSAGG
jgi:hypothetical protein